MPEYIGMYPLMQEDFSILKLIFSRFELKPEYSEFPLTIDQLSSQFHLSPTLLTGCQQFLDDVHAGTLNKAQFAISLMRLTFDYFDYQLYDDVELSFAIGSDTKVSILEDSWQSNVKIIDNDLQHDTYVYNYRLHGLIFACVDSEKSLDQIDFDSENIKSGKKKYASLIAAGRIADGYKLYLFTRP